MARSIKTEHTGAKNRGGYWGLRVEAKSRSNKYRRRADRATADKGLAEHEESAGGDPQDESAPSGRGGDR